MGTFLWTLCTHGPRKPDESSDLNLDIFPWVTPFSPKLVFKLFIFFPLNILRISCPQWHAYFSSLSPNMKRCYQWFSDTEYDHGPIIPPLKKLYFSVNALSLLPGVEQGRPSGFRANALLSILSLNKSGPDSKAGRETKTVLCSYFVWHIFPCKGLNPGLFLVLSNKKRNMYIVFLPSGEFSWKARMRITYLNSCLNTYN